MIFKITRGNAFTFHSSNFFTLTHSLYTTAVYNTIPSLKIEISL